MKYGRSGREIILGQWSGEEIGYIFNQIIYTIRSEELPSLGILPELLWVIQSAVSCMLIITYKNLVFRKLGKTKCWKFEQQEMMLLSCVIICTLVESLIVYLDIVVETKAHSLSDQSLLWVNVLNRFKYRNGIIWISVASGVLVLIKVISLSPGMCKKSWLHDSIIQSKMIRY